VSGTGAAPPARTHDDVLAATVAQIAAIIFEVTGQHIPPVARETPLDEIDGLDSLRVIETVALLEDRYGVAVDPHALDRLRTVDDIAWIITNAT
jgi:acyl carrier protein